MTEKSTAHFISDARGDWVRLRTLMVLRWVAIVGQVTAITIALRYYHLQLELGLVLVALGASVIANLISIFVYPENKRLTETQAVLLLLFDISQLSALVFLTGGLNNPFALLIMAPVTISATALHLRSTFFLGFVALGLTTLLSTYYIPLRTEQGFILRLPNIFVFGFWVSIVIGTVFLGIYARRVSSEIHNMSEALAATQTALLREQKLTDLGGVIAAAAHELGTPLATIKLVSTEMLEDLSDSPALREDAELIRDQADRCREILQSMGRIGKDDLHMRTAPLSTFIEEAAEPHIDRGKTVHFKFDREGDGGMQPIVFRQPEMIHGIRNLIQNAVDFAEKNVWVEAHWTQDFIRLQIIDDGAGFPSHLLGRIGDPFVRRRRSAAERAKRPEYEGMGLGLFIAKTLLERSGADLTFANGSDPFLADEERPEKCGAIVEVKWQRFGHTPEATTPRRALGQNQPIDV